MLLKNGRTTAVKSSPVPMPKATRRALAKAKTRAQERDPPAQEGEHQVVLEGDPQVAQVEDPQAALERGPREVATEETPKSPPSLWTGSHNGNHRPTLRSGLPSLEH